MISSIVLCAGKGSRLKNLTTDTPKCLLYFAGKTLFEHQGNALLKCGIKERNIVTGFKGRKFDTFKFDKWHNDKWENSNMVSSLFCAEEILEKNNEILIHYGDIIFEKSIVSKLLNTEGDIVVSVDKSWKEIWEKRFKNPLIDAESLKIDEHGNIIDIGLKCERIEEIEGQYIGLIYLRKKGIKAILDFKENYNLKHKFFLKNKLLKDIYMTDMLRSLIFHGEKVKSSIIHKGWLEFDNVHDFNLYNNLLEKNKLINYINIES